MTLIVFIRFNTCNIAGDADAVLSETTSAATLGERASVRIVRDTDTPGSGAGANELMIQTGDSVKETQNRRATIDLN